MDDQMKTTLLAYLEKLEELARQGSDFAAEQTPLMLQEYITYCRITSTASFVVGVILIFTGLVLARKSLNHENWQGKSEFPPGIVYGIASILLLILPTPLVVGDRFNDCVKSWIAPRVLLIEKVNELRKS